MLCVSLCTQAVQPPVKEEYFISDLAKLVMTESYVTELDPQLRDLRVRIHIQTFMNMCGCKYVYVQCTVCMLGI